MNPEILRLFVAIPISETIRNEISHFQTGLREMVRGNVVRWTKPEQFHLTLKFLGSVSITAVDSLKQSVEKVCKVAQPLKLRVEGIGFFPNTRAPRVIWAGIKDETGNLAGLQSQIEIATRPFAENSKQEKFSGHATFGRFKKYRQRDIENLLKRAQTMSDFVFGCWTAREIQIIRSELSQNGTRHTVLAAFALGAG